VSGEKDSALFSEASDKMTVDTAVTALNWGTVVFGFLASWLWFKSTIVAVPPDPNSNEFVIVNKTKAKEIDVLATAEQQVRWNKRAAAATAVAVLCQAVAMALTSDLHSS
jgi:hypothetical protein